MIYLDNAATTFPKPDVVYKTVDYCQRNYAVNVGRGSYSKAHTAMMIVDETRELMSRLVGAAGPDRVIFTPSATIAANEIIMGLEWTPYKTVYVTPFEHNAIARPLHKVLNENHISAHMIPFDSSTQELLLDDLERMFTVSPPDYVFINHVSNVTGVVLPIRLICEKAKEYGAIVIVDGSQSVGLIDIDVIKEKIDFLIFAGHKNLYASFGVGGFIMGNCQLAPVICGGTGTDSLNFAMPTDSPAAFEAGSHNIIAISSLNASLKWIDEMGLNEIKVYKDSLMNRLIAGIEDSSIITYLPTNRSLHTSVLSINIPGYQASEVGLILNEDYDIAVRTGYHCAPYIHRFLDTEQHLGTVRISLGYFNTQDEIDSTINALK